MTLTAQPAAATDRAGGVEVTNFGRTTDGQTGLLFTLRHPSGLSAGITNHGAALVSLVTPDRRGLLADIVLGLDNVADYEANGASMGATIGRYANRIAQGRFRLDGREIRLPLNADGNTLHGGPRGFSKVVWSASPLPDALRPGVRLGHVSEAGDQGFPGRLQVSVTYRLHQDRLTIEYDATTDAATVVNFTNHSYFNLGGDLASSVLDHRLTVDATRFTVPGEGLIPSGEIAPVAGTPLDFRVGKAIGREIAADHPLITLGGGFDHNLIIAGARGRLRRAARLESPESGRVLEVWSTEPGLQLYSANWLRDLRGKGTEYKPRTAVCLEPQHYPDSPNQPKFPSTRLGPGERFRSVTEFRLEPLMTCARTRPPSSQNRMFVSDGPVSARDALTTLADD